MAARTGTLFLALIGLMAVMIDGTIGGKDLITFEKTAAPQNEVLPAAISDTTPPFDEDHLSYITSRNCSRPLVARMHINPMQSAYKNWVMPKSQKEAGLLAFSFILTAALAVTPFICRWVLDGLIYILMSLVPAYLRQGEGQEL